MFGLVPICWTIINAMFLYNITVETGKFEAIKIETFPLEKVDVFFKAFV